MSDSVREAFEKWAREKYYTMVFPLAFSRYSSGEYMNAEIYTAYEIWQAATAAADAEWRGVEALEYVEANYDGMNNAAIVRQALAQAEKLMGGKP